MSEFDELMRQRAVALKYNPEKNGAPVIVASGMGYMAERITETAMKAGVPVYEDDSLATLLTQLQRFRQNCIRPLWIFIFIFWGMCRSRTLRQALRRRRKGQCRTRRTRRNHKGCPDIYFSKEKRSRCLCRG